MASSEDLGFEGRTLRLIIGALAFAFPATVIDLTLTITTSISASYYNQANRDVFVGFLFILGALLIAYKGHLHGEPRLPTQHIGQWLLSFQWLRLLSVYQEDLISTVGGVAAIFTALHPTACDGCAINDQARIHMTGACILFGSVVYFCLVAFPRSVNNKLLEENPAFENPEKPMRDTWWLAIPNFIYLTRQLIQSYDRNNYEQIARALLSKPDRKNPETLLQAQTTVTARKPNKLKFLWQAYDKKFARGLVYLICGPIITITLIIFGYYLKTQPVRVAHSGITFYAETISLIFFGIAWLTASKLEYLKQFESLWQMVFKKAKATAPSETAGALGQ